MLYSEKVAKLRLSFVIVPETFGFLFGSLVVTAEYCVVLRSLYSKNLLDVVEEIRYLVVVVFLKKQF